MNYFTKIKRQSQLLSINNLQKIKKDNARCGRAPGEIRQTLFRNVINQIGNTLDHALDQIDDRFKCAFESLD